MCPAPRTRAISGQVRLRQAARGGVTTGSVAKATDPVVHSPARTTEARSNFKRGLRARQTGGRHLGQDIPTQAGETRVPAGTLRCAETARTSVAARVNRPACAGRSPAAGAFPFGCSSALLPGTCRVQTHRGAREAAPGKYRLSRHSPARGRRDLGDLPQAFSALALVLSRRGLGLDDAKT
jgi:hypothetical protein